MKTVLLWFTSTARYTSLPGSKEACVGFVQRRKKNDTLAAKPDHQALEVGPERARYLNSLEEEKNRERGMAASEVDGTVVRGAVLVRARSRTVTCWQP
jgi:hypothetical protein